jgi:hypothetical protein
MSTTRGAHHTANGAAKADRRNDIQVVVGLLAGIAALIYLAGGAALGLRLLFAGIPGLPVGYLPREFLFSLGAAEVVVPAFLFGVMFGLLELGQRHDSLVDGHKAWSEAKNTPELRRTYIAFFGAVPARLSDRRTAASACRVTSSASRRSRRGPTRWPG